MDKIRKFFEQKFHLFESSKTSGEKVLEELSLEGIVDYIKKNNVTKIITLAGAGISTCNHINLILPINFNLKEKKNDLPLKLNFSCWNPRLSISQKWLIS